MSIFKKILLRKLWNGQKIIEYGKIIKKVEQA